jgi:quercetin dioxygenase-like cupin family protein
LHTEMGTILWCTVMHGTVKPNDTQLEIALGQTILKPKATINPHQSWREQIVK